MSALQTMMPDTTNPQDQSSEAGETLRRLDAGLAALIDLRQQVKQAHWNVTGPGFIGLHRLFDQLAEELDSTIDETAERQRALGYLVKGSLREAAKTSVLMDFPLDLTRAENVLSHLAKIYRTVSSDVRDEIEYFTTTGDPGTADLLTDTVRLLDQHLYLVTSHLV